MEVTVTNFQVKKSINMTLPDEFFDDIENTRFIVGTDQYKLVSTKSEEDKNREREAVAFGEEVYDQLYAQYPDFGTENSSVSKEQMYQIISDKIEEHKDKYPALLNDKNKEQLINSLVTAYSNYCTVRKRMTEEEKMIKETQIDENVFYDYIERFIKVFSEATCIKDIHEKIAKIHQYASIDHRELYGYAYIFKCLSPFYDKISEIETELKNMKPVVALKDHALFTDTEYWKEADKISIIKQVIENLKNLENSYREWEARTDTTKEVFDFYANSLIDQYQTVIDGTTSITNYTHEIAASQNGKLENLSIEQTNKIDELVKDSNMRYRNMLIAMTDLRIKYHLDSNKFASENESTVINANFGLIDFWSQTISSAPESEKFINLNKMVQQLKTHSAILKKVMNGSIKADDLIQGKYTTEELIKLAETPSED